MGIYRQIRQTIMDQIWKLLKSIPWEHLLLAIALFLFGYLFAKKISHLLERSVEKRFSRHQALLMSRFTFYGLLVLFSISALQQLGFNLTVLLGAAGLFTVALGFASQTAASNIVSGIFLLFERPFKIGDSIVYKNLKGTVEAIDWLSTKIKTSDNKLIRIPNEGLIKSEIINLSVYSQKRDEILLHISSSCEVEKVKALLQSIVSDNQEVLTKPAVKILMTQMIEDKGLELKVLYWSKKDLAEVRDELLRAIKIGFEKEKISLIDRSSLTLFQPQGLK